MEHAATGRIDHGLTAGAVLLAHAALVWIAMHLHAPVEQRETLADAVMATLIVQPRPRNLTFGPQPIHVKTEDVLHLQKLAPKVPDIPVDSPQTPDATEPVSLQAS